MHAFSPLAIHPSTGVITNQSDTFYTLALQRLLWLIHAARYKIPTQGKSISIPQQCRWVEGLCHTSVSKPQCPITP